MLCFFTIFSLFSLSGLAEEVEIAAVAAGAEGLRARKAQVLQTAVSNIIHLAEAHAQFRTTELDACVMPQAVSDGDVVVVLAFILRADLKIRSSHDLKESPAVDLIEAWDLIQESSTLMLLTTYDFDHVFTNKIIRTRRIFSIILESLIQRHPREYRSRQSLHLIRGLARKRRNAFMKNLLLSREYPLRRRHA